MSFLKKTFGMFSLRKKTRKSTGGAGFNKYSPSSGGFQSFRTRQDYQRKHKDSFLKSLKQRLFPAKKKHVDTGYAAQNIKKPKVGLALVKLCTAVLVVVSLGIASKSLFTEVAQGLKYFHIQNIEIKGCKVTSQQEIRESGGFSYGTSLFNVDPASAAAKLKEHKWIADAVVTRKWPDRLVINIKEFVPEAIVAQGSSGGDSLFYVNRQGVCFTPVKPGEDVDFPVITGLDTLSTEKDRKDAIGDALSFLKLANRNNPNLPAQLVSEINIDEKEGMVIYLVEHPFPIYYGREDVGKKYKQLRKVLEMLYKKQKNQMEISQVMYIRMDYLTNKVLVAQSGSG
jgi:cell division protein FtsQ